MVVVVGGDTPPNLTTPLCVTVRLQLSSTAVVYSCRLQLDRAPTAVNYSCRLQLSSTATVYSCRLQLWERKGGEKWKGWRQRQGGGEASEQKPGERGEKRKGRQKRETAGADTRPAALLPGLGVRVEGLGREQTGDETA